MKLKNIINSGSRILSRPHSNVYSAAMVIAFTYGMSMVLGIFRERLIVAKFYLCCRANLDAYYAAFRLPDMIFQLVVIGALSAAFIPVFTKVLNSDRERANRLASSVLNALLLIFAILAIVAFIFARPLSSLITGNFTVEQVNQMTIMTRIMLLAQILFLVSNFSGAIIQSNRRFLLPSLSPVAYNLGIIITVLLASESLGVWSAAVGVVIGAMFHLAIQLPLVRSLGFRYRPVIDFRDHYVREVGRLMLPRTISLAVGQIESTISLFLATSLSTGSLTLYYLAQKLADLPVRIIGTSIGQAALPLLIKQQDGKSEFKETLSNALLLLLFLALPITGIFLALRLQLVRLAYGSGSFPWEATIATGQVMALIVISIFSQSATQLIVRAYYAVCDTKTPLYISLVSVTLNICISLLLIYTYKLGVLGLAVAYTLANIVNFIALLILFHQQHSKIVGRREMNALGRMVQATVVATLVTWLSMRFLDQYLFDTSRVIPLAILTFLASLLGVISYTCSSWLLKIDELKLIGLLLRRLPNFRRLLADRPVVGETTEITP